MSIIRAIFGRPGVRRSGGLSWDQYLDQFAFGGQSYPYGSGFSQTLIGAKQEIADGSFESFVRTAYRSNGVVFAVMLARMALFSEARFQFRRMSGGRPGDLFGTADLDILEHPWFGGTTGDLLNKMLADADLAGNSYIVRKGNQLVRMRPDRVGIVTDGENVGGHIYYPDGLGAGMPYEVYMPGEVAHFAPITDPLAKFKGMSWITPIVREFAGDSAARDHKLAFFENGATPNMVVKLDKDSKAAQSTSAFKEWVERFRETEPKGRDVYKTMYLAGGTDVTIVGRDMQQLDFKQIQGAGETRIAAAGGVPPVIVGLSEGLQAATYSNYGQARRRFADLTMRPLWRNVAGSLAVIVPPPAGADLWYDDRDIPFLAEDRKDAAEIAGREAATIRTLVEAGYKPETVIAAIQNGDWSLLVHTGALSVQLTPVGADGASVKEPAGAADVPARALAALIAPYLPKAGASADPFDGPAPRAIGFAPPARAGVFNDLTAGDVREFVANNVALLSASDAVVGGWRQGGVAHLGIFTRHPGHPNQKTHGRKGTPRADTQQMYKQADGSYAPGRAALHEEIIGDILKGGVPNDAPEATILGGGPAAGKSNIEKSGHLGQQEGGIVVNPDKVKARLPEYEDGQGASRVHEESSDVSKMALARAQAQKLPITYDTTGDSSYDSVKSKADAFHAKGYKTNAEYVTAPTSVAIARSKAREAATGRHVPETYLRQTHSAVSRVVPQAVANRLWTNFRLWDTGSGGAGVLVASYRDRGALTIHKPDLWDAFIAKGSE